MRYKLDVFGRPVLVERSDNQWHAYYIGHDGKRGAAHDIIIPPRITDRELVSYIADLCHEWADPEHTDVRVLEGPNC